MSKTKDADYMLMLQEVYLLKREAETLQRLVYNNFEAVSRVMLRLMSGVLAAFFLSTAIALSADFSQTGKVFGYYAYIVAASIWALFFFVSFIALFGQSLSVYKNRPKTRRQFLRSIALIRNCLYRGKCVNKRTRLHILRNRIALRLSLLTGRAVVYDLIFLSQMRLVVFWSLFWPLLYLKGKRRTIASV